MKTYTVYSADGEIICSISGTLEQVEAQEIVISGGFFVETPNVVSGDTHYMNTSSLEIAEKKDYTLDALPLPCTITIEGITYEVTEQPTFEFDLAGTYIVEVDAGPRFLRKEFTIDYQA